jgi:hypothetical protein
MRSSNTQVAISGKYCFIWPTKENKQVQVTIFLNMPFILFRSISTLHVLFLAFKSQIIC